MAKVTYKSYNQNDSLLFPHCIGDFIPENDPVRVLDAIVEHLDISAIEATYKGGGASSFAPRMLLKVVLYAYLQNIYSGRKMEALHKRDVNFMWLSEMNYEYMVSNQITPFVKYNMFHAEMKRKRKNNPFYVCPMGQHLDFLTERHGVSELGYGFTTSVYRSTNCSGCPLRSMCYKGKCNTRTIEVNHRNNELRAMARELLTSEDGLKH